MAVRAQTSAKANVAFTLSSDGPIVEVVLWTFVFISLKS